MLVVPDKFFFLKIIQSLLKLISKTFGEFTQKHFALKFNPQIKD